MGGRWAVLLVAACAVAGCTSHASSSKPPASSTTGSSSAAPSTSGARTSVPNGITAAASPSVTATPIGDGSANAKDACTAYTNAIAELHQNPPQVDQAVAQLATMTASADAAATANRARWQRLAADAKALAGSLNSGSFVKQPGADDPAVLAVARDCR